MNAPVNLAKPAAAKAEHFDVLIVGAGISGVGAAYHLQDQMPGKSYVVLEAEETFGGTWWTHRYPGIRSDSDLYTFGYRFKAWEGTPIATAEAIRNYMGAVIEENHLDRHIRYRHRIINASWSSQTCQWTIDAVRGDTGEAVQFTAGFLWMCQGYYRHNEGYMPEWPGMQDYKGEIVHPENWPEGFDLKGKKVVVIGSGATAATLIPSIADDVSHVTMLQRSPTYFVPGRNADDLADTLRQLNIDPMWTHEIVRRKRLFDGAAFSKRALEDEETVKKELLGAVRMFLPEEDVQKHFTPSYRPWRQRIAFVPDADMFRAIQNGKASVVTDEIERFTETGLLLKSGDTLDADVIITATGFNLNVLGDIHFTVDGEPLKFGETVTYRGMMFTGLPNLVWVFGYFRASWTLRADLIGDFVCRLLKHMDEIGARKVEVALRPDEEKLERLSWIDPENFNPSYLMRAMDQLPKRLDRPEWQHTQDYWNEKDAFPAIDLEGSEFVYGGKGQGEQAAAARETVDAE